MLVVEQGNSRVISIYDSNGDGFADSIAVIAQVANLTHGIVVHKGFLYASSYNYVYRWSYTPKQRTESTDRVTVIKNMLDDGHNGTSIGHQTRTLVFDKRDTLYVAIGS